MIDLIVDGFTYGDSALIVTTNSEAGSIFADVEQKLGQSPTDLRIIDCVSENRSVEQILAPDHLEFVSSPGDLTGIGICLSEQLKQFVETGNDRIRIGFYSLSTLLMYAELETVFRFIHVLCGRIDSIDGLGLFAMDPTIHDESTVNTLKQLFSGMIDLRHHNNERQIRFAGIPDAPNDWISLA